MEIKNPILPGFNPDPSILRVEDDYYIATSTFEWFPGVQIHHSKDLVNWRLLTHPLNRTSQLNMAGNPNSCGVWAPCLSYDKGTFYLIFSDVKTFRSPFKDVHNYLVTTDDIMGDWSDPIYLNSSGFDPSLFHDIDGRKWLTNVLWDHRKGKNPFSGILLQEYSTEEKKLIGPITNIYQGTEIGLVEGSHIYKKDGYYYLMTAEGGTVYKHAVTMARSKQLAGPYETDPENPILTSYNNPSLELQRAGHASLVETQTGEWYLAHLCGRYLPSRGRCIMGRETALQKMTWTPDGWLRLQCGGNEPQLTVAAPKLPECKWDALPIRDDFDDDKLNINFQFLRVKLDSESYSLTERPGYLRLKGRESINSHHTQALIVRRQQAFCYSAGTCLDFNPESFQQMAGLTAFYDNENFYYLYVTHDAEHGKCLDIMSSVKGNIDFPLEKKIPLNEHKESYLRLNVRYDKLNFQYSEDGQNWKGIGPDLDCSTLSDEFQEGDKNATFTGAFVGLCCQDLTGRRLPADFDYFDYKETKA
ncbi:glycoside hydrolase family 43 protein [Maribacter sp. TH_r10]|uniref:glycoside hydrolase family 43 protein n=1 Tax=Maribacter sp. TH_r10 TaxID=3082086 RepID=UPI00295536A3|nr:glycoside hydrolase family 43 protein [Maribacter sp. TH_r10]MDV7140158.1 glycoside hydrolase family 43 protein [Maribacter sp. TH_r10]